jgi:hypothetical protein
MRIFSLSVTGARLRVAYTLFRALARLSCLTPMALRAQTPGAGSCKIGWSEPFALRDSLGHPAYVEPGTGVSFRGRALVFGDPTFIWLTRDHMVPQDSASLKALDSATVSRAFQQNGLLIDSSGRVTPVPRALPGSGMKYPGSAKSGVDRVHVVYAVDTVQGRGGSDPDRLFFATYDSKGWSRSELVLEGTRFSWHWGSNNLMSARGDVLAAAALSSRADEPSIRVVRYSDGRWRTVAYSPSRRLALHGVATTINRVGMPVLLMSGFSSDEPTALLAVRMERWDDTGAVWSREVPIDSVARTAASEIGVVQLGADSLLVVWNRRVDVNTRRTRHAIASALSVDGGARWRLSDSLTFGAGLSGLRVLADESGGVHALFSAPFDIGVLGAPGRIQHAMWIDGHWSPIDRVSNDDSFVAPTGVVMPGGLLAIWAKPQGTLLTNLEPRSYAAMWRSRCPG